MITPPRKPTLGDAMILIAAVAAGLGLARMAVARDDPRRPRVVSTPRYRASYAIQYVHDLTLPCVFTLSVAQLALRLRRPRPGSADIVCQPGSVACGMGVVSAGIVTAVAPGPPSGPMCNHFLIILTFSDVTVGFVWIVWWLNGRWKPEPVGIDRLGRALGIGWIALPALPCPGPGWRFEDVRPRRRHPLVFASIPG